MLAALKFFLGLQDTFKPNSYKLPNAISLNEANIEFGLLTQILIFLEAGHNTPLSDVQKNI